MGSALSFCGRESGPSERPADNSPAHDSRWESHKRGVTAQAYTTRATARVALI